MDRRLLPYEYQLIEALGVSKEEYLEFVALQQEYKDPKAGTALDVRAADPGTVAIVLTVVGILFQVGAALLAPKPSIPDLGADNKRRNRQQRFAPSFGFNGAPELAAYGDPVNLVYTSSTDNPDGGVRVSGSLVWSAVDNFGSSQFMQLLFVLGAAQIKNISADRTAFGSLALGQLDPSTAFLFYPLNGVGRPPRLKDLVKGKRKFLPPSLEERPDNQDVCKIVGYRSGQRKGVEGFSQAYSPTTSSSLGIYDPVPIKVEMQTRDSEGEEQDGPIGVTLEDGKWQSSISEIKKVVYNENDKIQVKFEKKGYTGGGDDEVVPLALNFRRQAVNALDFGSTYMLGSAKFRLLSFGEHRDPDNGDVNATFQCVETGRCPSFDYEKEVPVNNVKEEKKKLQNDLKILKNLFNDNQIDPPSDNDSFVSSASLTSLEEGDDSNKFNVPDDQRIEDTYNIKPARNTNNSTVVGKDCYKLGGCEIQYNYSSERKVTWNDVTYNPNREKKDSQGNVVYDKDNGMHELSITSAGSIKYTEYLESKALNDPPTIKTEEVRQRYRKDIRKLKLIIRHILNGNLDDDGALWVPLVNQSFDQLIRARIEADATPGTHILPSGKDKFGHYTLLFYNMSIENIKARKDKLQARIDRLEKKKVDQSPKLKESSFETDGENPITATNRNRRTYATYTDTVNLDDRLLARNVRLDQDIKAFEADIAKRKAALAGQIRGIVIDYLENTGDGTVIYTPALPADQNWGPFDAFEFSLGGLNTLEDKLEDLPSSKRMVDVNSLKAIESAFAVLKKQKQSTILDIRRFLKKWDDCIAAADNNFFVKALVKAESAAYETVSEVDQVKFSIKSKLFRRISGRQLKYGDTPADQKYSLGDNGIHGRQAFFRFSYKKADQGDDGWTVHPALFAIRQSSESEAYNDFNFYAPSRAKYAFKIDPVYDVASEIALNGQTKFAVLDSHEGMKRKDNSSDTGFVWWNGKEQDSQKTGPAGSNLFPNLQERGPKLTNEWDVFSVNTDTQVQFSFESGPELALTAVTEQQIASTVNELGTGMYKDLSLFSLSMFANRGIQDLRNVTAFVTEGKMSYKVEDLNARSSESTSYAPDIFVDTVLDEINGIGRYAPSTVLDKSSLELAKNFCKSNNLPTELDFDSGESVEPITLNMDGVIADQSSWRDFWVNNAPFSLLEFARKNGKETLVPALPVNNDGQAADANGYPISLTISALFTTGNILEDSYKEEFLDYGTSTQDLVASIIYREEYSKSIFQRKRTVNVRRLDIADLPSSIRETFDLSAFVTSRQQAVMFGKMLVNQRRYIRRGVEFKTFPSSNPIEPGAFIYVDIGFNSWDKTSSGVVSEDLSLNSPLQNKIEDGQYNFLFYKRNSAAVEAVSDVTIPDRLTAVLAERAGQLYVMGQATNTKRVFRVTEVEMDEEGEVTVRAIEYPCDDQQRARVADFRPSLFKVS